MSQRVCPQQNAPSRRALLPAKAVGAVVVVAVEKEQAAAAAKAAVAAAAVIQLPKVGRVVADAAFLTFGQIPTIGAGEQMARSTLSTAKVTTAFPPFPSGIATSISSTSEPAAAPSSSLSSSLSSTTLSSLSLSASVSVAAPVWTMSPDSTMPGSKNQIPMPDPPAVTPPPPPPPVPQRPATTSSAAAASDLRTAAPQSAGLAPPLRNSIISLVAILLFFAAVASFVYAYRRSRASSSSRVATTTGAEKLSKNNQPQSRKSIARLASFLGGSRSSKGSMSMFRDVGPPLPPPSSQSQMMTKGREYGSQRDSFTRYLDSTTKNGTLTRKLSGAGGGGGGGGGGAARAVTPAMSSPRPDTLTGMVDRYGSMYDGSNVGVAASTNPSPFAPLPPLAVAVPKGVTRHGSDNGTITREAFQQQLPPQTSESWRLSGFSFRGVGNGGAGGGGGYFPDFPGAATAAAVAAAAAETTSYAGSSTSGDSLPRFSPSGLGPNTYTPRFSISIPQTPSPPDTALAPSSLSPPAPAPNTTPPPPPPLTAAATTTAAAAAAAADFAYTILHGWLPQRSDELLLESGDRVAVFQVFEDGWCEGMSQRSGLAGVFPLACLRDPRQEQQGQQQQQQQTQADNGNQQRKRVSSAHFFDRFSEVRDLGSAASAAAAAASGGGGGGGGGGGLRPPQRYSSIYTAAPGSVM
ncbi:hypothetical protein HDU87_008514 [Geranomyces variabilis]|uniref:SH3 domain-containing protein n=1 Tax=Geranomyces variabilis TaxID=109894 RepID=A0AAD5TRH2_9FUNG|nr:hypothetical protein HDU87_008514 [Geranomyces variabilis]